MSNVLYRLETNIPLPAPKKSSKYPLANMRIGDSFLIDAKDAIPYSQAKVLGMRLAARKVNNTTIRVWRRF